MSIVLTVGFMLRSIGVSKTSGGLINIGYKTNYTIEFYHFSQFTNNGWTSMAVYRYTGGNRTTMRYNQLCLTLLVIAAWANLLLK